MKYKIVAILDRSAGNEAVGEMWHETKVFDNEDSIDNIIKWAAERTHCSDIGLFRGNLKLTIAQQ